MRKFFKVVAFLGVFIIPALMIANTCNVSLGYKFTYPGNYYTGISIAINNNSSSPIDTIELTTDEANLTNYSSCTLDNCGSSSFIINGNMVTITTKLATSVLPNTSKTFSGGINLNDVNPATINMTFTYNGENPLSITTFADSNVNSNNQLPGPWVAVLNYTGSKEFTIRSTLNNNLIMGYPYGTNFGVSYSSTWAAIDDNIAEQVVSLNILPFPPNNPAEYMTITASSFPEQVSVTGSIPGLACSPTVTFLNNASQYGLPYCSVLTLNLQDSNNTSLAS